MEQFLTYFTPKEYKLSLNINKHKKSRSGIVKIFGHSKTDFVKLHCVGTEVDYCEIDGEKVDFSLENCVLTVLAGSRSDFTLEVGFHGSLNENMQGAYLSSYQVDNREELIVSTQVESHYARECFPCIDEPAAKAVFILDITTPEKDKDTIISNMPIKNVVQNTTFTTTFFEPTPVMSTYLLAFVIGKFKSKSLKNSHGIDVTTYIPLNQSVSTLDFANEVAAKSLDYFDDLFGYPYPLKKLDQVAIPDFEAGAMENWGLVTYRESCLLADESSPRETQKSVALTISHELSHQWFGDLVTMKWWDDLWLNESFASVMEYYAIDHIFPEYSIWEDFFTGSCLSALRRDALYGVQPVRQDVESPAEIATLFDSAIVYAKGAHLMFMLIRLMGEESFFKGIKDYFVGHKYKNTSGDDLWAALQSYAEFDIKDFMHAWISQPGYPVITDGSARRFLFDSSITDNTEWPLPKITDDMSGHYLINLSGPEFMDALNNFDTLSLEQKLRLLIDRMLLAKTPIVSSGSLLDILPKFKTESSSSIWEILVSIISDLKIFIEPGTETEKKFKSFISSLVSPNLSRLGLNPSPSESSEDTRLRSILLGLAHYSEDNSIIDGLTELYEDDFAKIHPEIRDNVIFAKIRREEDKMFDIYLKKYQQISDPDIKFTLLCALANAKEEKHIDTLISLLKKPEIVKPQDHLYLYIFLRRNIHAKSRALDWLINNWSYIESMTGEKSIEDYPRYTAGTIRDESESDIFFAFFNKKKDNPVLSRTLKVAKTEISSRLSLIALDQKSVYSRLK